MTTLWVLLTLATVVLYAGAGVAVARHEARRLFTVNVRYVRKLTHHDRIIGYGRTGALPPSRGQSNAAELTPDEWARVAAEIRRDQWEILLLWPSRLAKSIATAVRARRAARDGRFTGWMMAGARAAEADLAAARAALEVWEREAAEAETDLAREAAQSMAETARDTIRKLEGR